MAAVGGEGGMEPTGFKFTVCQPIGAYNTWYVGGNVTSWGVNASGDEYSGRFAIQIVPKGSAVPAVTAWRTPSDNSHTFSANISVGSYAGQEIDVYLFVSNSVLLLEDVYDKCTIKPHTSSQDPRTTAEFDISVVKAQTTATLTQKINQWGFASPIMKSYRARYGVAESGTTPSLTQLASDGYPARADEKSWTTQVTGLSPNTAYNTLLVATTSLESATVAQVTSAPVIFTTLPPDPVIVSTSGQQKHLTVEYTQGVGGGAETVTTQIQIIKMPNTVVQDWTTALPSPATYEVPSGGTYKVRMRGQTSAGNSSSGVVSGEITVLDSAPTITSMNVSGTTLTVNYSYDGSASDTIGYRLRTVNGSWGNWVTVSSNPFTVALSANSAYQIQMRAVSSGGSAESGVYSEIYTAPNSPTVSNKRGYQDSVSFVLTADAATQAGSMQYEIRYKLSTASTWGVCSSGGTAQIFDLQPNTTYTIQIKTVNFNPYGERVEQLSSPTTTFTIRTSGTEFSNVYGSVNGKSKKILRFYGSVNGKSVRIKKLYGSVNGKSVLLAGDN